MTCACGRWMPAGEVSGDVRAMLARWDATRDGVLTPGLRLAAEDLRAELDHDWFDQQVARAGSTITGNQP